MINDVVLEGIVVKAWKYADDPLFRLACYRDPDMPQKPLNEVQDAADFVTIRVSKGNLGAPVVVEKNYLTFGCMVFCRAGITRRAWRIFSRMRAVQNCRCQRAWIHPWYGLHAARPK